MKSPKTASMPLQKVVIIITFMRSGSTFLGEIFNVHENTFYIFEPLHPWAANGCQSSIKEEKIKETGTITAGRGHIMINNYFIEVQYFFKNSDQNVRANLALIVFLPVKLGDY